LICLKNLRKEFIDMMKKEYEMPEIEAVRFETDDCITASTLPEITDADVIDGNNPNL